jgi:gamma-glutamyltranspeptidase/glutathione hydrolase
MEFKDVRHTYPSRRGVIYGKRGMVCTSQALAAQAGLDVLKKGGSAADAIVATAACMTVLEPTSNGLGSDAFALYWSASDHRLYGLNGSGWAPRLLTREAMKEAGYKEMPQRGWASVTVPGAVSAWSVLHRRFGRLPFASILEPAISYAENGYPVQPVTSLLWHRAVGTFAPYREEKAFAPLFDTFFKGGVPNPGTLVRLPDHARTLRKLAESDCESFYRGEVADAIDAFSRETGGYLRKEDLAAYEAEWVIPLHTSYHGYEVCELPPNGHGLVVLMALRILERLQGLRDREDAETVHKQLEAMKLAFVDGMEFITDPRYMKQKAEDFLSDAYADKRAAEIGEIALDPKPIDPDCGGTVYLCAADEEGNMVSFIQSNYRGFGSGIVIPEWGIALNDRASSFSLDEKAANVLVPGKKPYHTIIPGFLMKDGDAVGPFGVMGGYMQPQGHVQVLMNLIDFGLDPQEALDAPRWQWTHGKRVEMESGYGDRMVAALHARGHEMVLNDDFTSFGRGQMILRTPEGSYAGATEPRADGTVAAW